MTTIELPTTDVQTRADGPEFGEAHLAAVSFLARYSGRTLDAYRHDLRGFFQWAADHDIDVLAGTRPQIEWYRSSMEQRGLAASTIDRRLSTVCGFYRFAHLDGRIATNPAQYVRRPPLHPTDARGLDRSELSVFLFTAEHFDRDHSVLAVLLGLNGLRVSEACATNIEELGLERGHCTLRIIGKGNKPATIPLVPRTARTIDLAIGERHQGPILHRRDGHRLDRRTAHRWV
jgi:site-specific recombinase XerD